MENKKQLFTLFEDIVKLNNDTWGNKPGTYDAHKSAALLIEEALESIGDPLPKDNAREVVAISGMRSDDGEDLPPDVDAFDSLLDGLYITIGELHKLGLTPHQMTSGLAVVHNANLQKTGKKDAEGKVTKPEGFVPPEELLQEILDARQ